MIEGKKLPGQSLTELEDAYREVFDNVALRKSREFGYVDPEEGRLLRQIFSLVAGQSSEQSQTTAR